MFAGAGAAEVSCPPNDAVAILLPYAAYASQIQNDVCSSPPSLPTYASLSAPLSMPYAGVLSCAIEVLLGRFETVSIFSLPLLALPDAETTYRMRRCV